MRSQLDTPYAVERPVTQVCQTLCARGVLMLRLGGIAGTFCLLTPAVPRTWENVVNPSELAGIDAFVAIATGTVRPSRCLL